MSSVQLVLVISCCLIYTTFSGDLPKKDTPSEVVIHATNKTSVPSVLYVVDAVEILREAYTVYPDDPSRVKLYAELFQAKHNETQWNVVAGYTASHIKSKWYVETTVTGGKDNGKKDKKKDDGKDNFYLIFSQV